ncbi:S8 family serine peptidase [Calothrix sp. PCC 6303]|uniref:S8 family serine peptidase n=1 Tax=Calothrix sp. PCC 6303 TaxID=1170562 RepID=UPI0002A03D38|nr:S8 family serine peptidase [Calothrix sp. PCC 6303]AFY99903.1 peptidase S8 and S53 subtilisin kexin sedolisin [Calothrix sp. PCC 6303]
MYSYEFSASGSHGNGKSNPTQPPGNSGNSMPFLRMDFPGGRGEMPEAVNMNSTESSGNVQKVLVELRVSRTQNVFQAVVDNIGSLQIDTDYEPVAVTPTNELAASLLLTDDETYIIRGEIDERRIHELEAQANVVKVYKDTPIAPFNPALLEKQDLVKPMNGAGDCPIGTCDCSPTVAKGTIADVAKYFGVDQIWAAGFKGQGIVVGIVDGGITAEGRPVEPFEGIRRIPNVIGGPAKNWGTKAKSWGEHGNMCATDVLGMAPEAKLYDCRIADGDAVSNALMVFDWALQQYRTDGTPQVLSNSWGIYQKSWDEFYATNPDHPFTRKVVEVINEGILVLFAAGNCGASCPNDRCGADNGSGRSIWGANGHPLVMTIGAVNKDEQFVGYSSTGPASLDPNKPDFCSVTHFRGYFGSDNGTSAATPIAAGVIALLKQAKPNATQDELKNILKQTAKNIGEPGFDQNSGAGIIQPKVAFDLLAPQLPKWGEWENLGGNAFSAPSAIASGVNCLKTFVLGGDNSIYQKSLDADKWGEWESLDGFSLSAPASIAVEENIHVFSISQERQIQLISFNAGSWGTWQNLGGFCKHGVAVTASTPNQIDVFTIGSDNAVYQMTWDGKSTTAGKSLGGLSLSAPAAVSSQQNRIDLFVRGVDHAIYHKYWNGTAWSDNWESLGGVWLYAPTVTSWGANRLDVFAVGTDNAVYRKYSDGVTWSSWENIGGSCIASPAAVSANKNQIDLFVVGGDNVIYRRKFV